MPLDNWRPFKMDPDLWSLKLKKVSSSRGGVITACINRRTFNSTARKKSWVAEVEEIYSSWSIHIVE